MVQGRCLWTRCEERVRRRGWGRTLSFDTPAEALWERRVALAGIAVGGVVLFDVGVVLGLVEVVGHGKGMARKGGT
jgi:hypothetical protein